VAGTRITRAGNLRYRYDAAGRVVARTRTRISRKPETWRYEWDADDRLVAVAAPDGTRWRYRYDPLGRRVAKQHLDASSAVLAETRFSWDGAVLAEQAVVTADGSAGNSADGRELVTTWDYQPGTFTPLAQASRTLLRDAPQALIDERFAAIITDLSGAPAELIAPDGTLAGYQQRTLWGNTRWHPSGEQTPLRFPGQYADPETGLHYNNQRYYDPVSGAYLSPDPLGLSPAPNPHAYVDNPQVLIDPLGLMSCDTGQNDLPGGPEGSSWAEQSGILRAAAQGKGNFGLGSATASQAEQAGLSWVGEGYRVASDGKTLISQDGMRQFRPPSYKPRLGIYQANFQQKVPGQVARQWFSNGHLDIMEGL